MQLKRDGEYFSEPKAEIVCVDADGHYVIIHTKNDGVFRIHKGINKTADELADANWHVMIHPSHLVHFLEVHTYKKCSKGTEGECVLYNGMKFPLSESGFAMLKMRIRQWEEEEKKKESDNE